MGKQRITAIGSVVAGWWRSDATGGSGRAGRGEGTTTTTTTTTRWRGARWRGGGWSWRGSGWRHHNNQRGRMQNTSDATSGAHRFTPHDHRLPVDIQDDTRHFLLLRRCRRRLLLTSAASAAASAASRCRIGKDSYRVAPEGHVEYAPVGGWPDAFPVDFTLLFIHSSIHWFNRSLIQSIIHSFVRSFVHSFIHSKQQQKTKTKR